MLIDLDIREIKYATFKARGNTSDRGGRIFSDATGLIVRTSTEEVCVVEDVSTGKLSRLALLSYRGEMNKVYQITESPDSATLSDLLRLLLIPSIDSIDALSALKLAYDELVGMRWRKPTHSLLTHDANTFETFLVPALENPVEFLSQVRLVNPSDEVTDDSTSSDEEKEMAIEPLDTGKGFRTVKDALDNNPNNINGNNPASAIEEELSPDLI